jgi:hypothetical protein
VAILAGVELRPSKRLVDTSDEAVLHQASKLMHY